MSRRWRLDFWSGVLAVAFAVVAVLMVWPLYNIFAASVIDNRSGALTFANFADPRPPGLSKSPDRQPDRSR